MTLIVALWLLVSSQAVAQRVPMMEVPREMAKDDLARDAFRIGIEAFKKGDYSKAEENLKTVPELGGFLSLYTHWFMGQSLHLQGKLAEAIPHFQQVVEAKSSTELKYQAQFFLAKIAMEQKKWADAEQKLQKLERKWRRSNEYGEILYDLALVDLKLKRTPAACKWAKKLFVKIPAHPKVLAWSNLKDQSIEDMKISCAVSHKELQDRVRKLQLSGESEKARTELLSLQSQTTESERAPIDMLMANFLVNEGLVDDALNLLVRYYPTFKGNFTYLTLLGKAAARAGEFQTSVGAFERAYQMSPRSKQGREALFQAAYLSYQFQDYDGAVRKFEQFVKQQPRSGLAKDAQWHLAWLRYLRGDYKGALERFESVRKSIQKRKSSSESLEQRLAYWSAMSQFKLNKLVEAKAGFEIIQQNAPFSYYGLASQSRLLALKDVNVGGDRGPTSQSKDQLSVAVTDSSATPPIALQEEDESEEAMIQTEDVDASESAEEEIIQASDFKDPLLRSRIEIAQKLIELGLPELAKWELWEVERRTRNSQYLRMLMTAYEGIGSYNRSASISELNFGKDREVAGLEGGRTLWTAMFPQAYKVAVQKSAKQHSIPPEVVWAIMRTESLYKPDVVSPVGARGLMQLMPFTARNLRKLSGISQFDSAELFKPDVNVQLGSQYLSRLSQKFKGSLPLISAAYNAGPHRVENWLIGFGHLDADEFVEHIPFMETRNYVKKVVRNQVMYRRLYAKDQKPPDYLAKGLGVPIPARPSAKESWESL